MVFWCKGLFILDTIYMSDSLDLDLQQETTTIAPEVSNTMLDDNARVLYNSEIRIGSAFSPLSLTYYIFNDKGDVSIPENADLKGAIEEQKIIYDLFADKTNPNVKPEDRGFILQSPAGWKELLNIINEPEFGKKTVEYLKISRSIEKSKGETRIVESLTKTIEFLETNLNQSNHGA